MRTIIIFSLVESDSQLRQLLRVIFSCISYRERLSIASVIESDFQLRQARDNDSHSQAYCK